MKTLFIFRDSYEAKYILQQLEKKGILGDVVIEKGVSAKRQKLRRFFKTKSILLYPLIVLDIIALAIYSKLITMAMIKILGKNNTYPKNKIKLIVDDANDKLCMEFVDKYQPEIIFIYGTSILKSQFLDHIKSLILNIHSGIVPKYRNVHSDFWAYLNNDIGNIGVSILHLNRGIDSGDLALQEKVDYNHRDSMVDIKIKNLKVIPNLVDSIIKKKKNGTLGRQKQLAEKGSFYPTPRLLDLIKFTCSLKKK
jgi:folate-dependent phosphoribosylglycinamide formyltransferase PurN